LGFVDSSSSRAGYGTFVLPTMTPGK